MYLNQNCFLMIMHTYHGMSFATTNSTQQKQKRNKPITLLQKEMKHKLRLKLSTPTCHDAHCTLCEPLGTCRLKCSFQKSLEKQCNVKANGAEWVPLPINATIICFVTTICHRGERFCGCVESWPPLVAPFTFQTCGTWQLGNVSSRIGHIRCHLRFCC